ncbi:MalY/PatB family protein [Bacillus sp. FJAT-45037]|uniref:MalY/PatB family protein n=1 Tax=Bacillus sp. FJAT-45037 TaxID=2011007 RepID=UPI000C24D8B1|nr:MalY/PatB family protein [Bacillus sp. FJAT-45037]
MSKHLEFVVDRKNTDSMKWDMTETRFGVKDAIPLWVADMDIKAPNAVIEALKDKATHGVFGYPSPSLGTDEAICAWLAKRYKWEINREALIYTSGIVPTISHMIQAFTEPGDEVIIQTPVYYPFYDVIEKNDRVIVKNPLTRTDDQYEMDFIQLETSISEKTKVLLLSHPHNPVGRVWKQEELERVAEICKKYDLLVISDEIHADLLFDGQTHIPIASINEDMAKRTLTCLAPSKTFNLAGIQASYAVILDPKKRLKCKTFIQSTFSSINVFSQVATEAAYRHGEEWLNELMGYIQENYQFVKEYLEGHMPKIKVVKPEGTYLLWLDCEQLKMEASARNEWFLREAKVAFNHGPIFGTEGEHFERMNIACSRDTLARALDQMKEAYDKKGF